MMNKKRLSGVLLHPTSFPGRMGSAILGRRRTSLSIFLFQRGRASGRCCHLDQPVTVILLTRAIRLSPATRFL